MDSLAVQLLAYAGAAVAAVLGMWAMIKIIAWAKGMSTGAYLTLAIFPLISLFPIPPTEIKISSVENQDAALWNGKTHFLGLCNIRNLASCYINNFRNISLIVEEEVHLDCAFSMSVPGPVA